MSEEYKPSVEEKLTEQDRLNREIAQEAGTDQELESMVPPLSVRSNFWRVGIAAIIVVFLLFLVIQFY